MPLTNLTIARPKIITVLGSGVWGSTIVTLARRNRNIVRSWSRQGNQSMSSAIAQADIIISAVSAAGIKPTIARLQNLNLDNTIIVSTTKGLICPSDNEQVQTPAQIWQKAFPNLPVVVLSGANVALEIAQGLPTATVVASDNPEAAKTVQQAFASDSFWVHLQSDPLGTELGGILKNIMAIAIGVCDGLELGANAKAIILTKAIPEMIRIGTYLGGDAPTFLSLAGWGDLIASCDRGVSSKGDRASHNYQLGHQLAQSKPLSDITPQLTGVNEQLETAKTIMQVVAEGKIQAPITKQMFQLLQGQVSPYVAIYNLINSEIEPEFESVSLL